MTAIYGYLAIPFGWLLNIFYKLLDNNYLLALIAITIITRAILLPSSIKQQKNSAKQMRLQAKVNKIRAKYPEKNRESQMKIQEETQELYKREGFSATSAGCAPLVISLVVMMGLYSAIYSPLTYVLKTDKDEINAITEVYSSAVSGKENNSSNMRIELEAIGNFDKIKEIRTSELEENKENKEKLGVVTDTTVTEIDTFKEKFKIGKVDLTASPNDNKSDFAFLLIPILAGVTALMSGAYTYIRQRKTNPEMAKNPMMGCMSFASPLISVFFAFSFPAGIGVYWIISNILSFIQMIALNMWLKPEKIIAQQMIDETVVRRSRENQVKRNKELVAAAREKEE